MRLLLCLAEHAGEVVSIDGLLDQVWPGVIVTPDSVYQAVAQLRRLLGDDSKGPRYVETVPRLGYRLVAAVSPLPDDRPQDQCLGRVEARTQEQAGSPSVSVDGFSESQDSENEQRLAASKNAPTRGPRSGLGWPSALIVCLALGGAFALLFHGKVANSRPASIVIAHPPPNSVAVLPFLDLTEGMKEEEFADGMTEELIDKFSKIPGVHVPAPTASFYFKNKKMPLTDIARTLGVGYVLDGSVRRSGSRLRVAARLFCADSGYVIWAQTYDRPWSDVLTLQDDIACEVMSALKASLAAKGQAHTRP